MSFCTKYCSLVTKVTKISNQELNTINIKHRVKSCCVLYRLKTREARQAVLSSTARPHHTPPTPSPACQAPRHSNPYHPTSPSPPHTHSQIHTATRNPPSSPIRHNPTCRMPPTHPPPTQPASSHPSPTCATYPSMLRAARCAQATVVRATLTTLTAVAAVTSAVWVTWQVPPTIRLRMAGGRARRGWW